MIATKNYTMLTFPHYSAQSFSIPPMLHYNLSPYKYNPDITRDGKLGFVKRLL